MVDSQLRKVSSHAIPYGYSFVNSASLVGRIDHFCFRGCGNMPEGFGNRRDANQTCRAEQEERIAVAGSENFFVWTYRSPTVPDRGRDRQRARLGGRVSEATGRSDYRSEPAAK